MEEGNLHLALAFAKVSQEKLLISELLIFGKEKVFDTETRQQHVEQNTRHLG